ncbi:MULTISPECIES: TetR/AcrR family transcriptional regulator C-terminal domain-containing protein [unclassified Pseudofrankia]|uniref:TetR/AcrR family transcriptional regulator C-terminal domain-containing protein n=1 Tax=unclassified Pseudofrankia TaxID=2994372 RepID=UPI0008D9F8B9|nr:MULTISPECIES: TetR/AcrR family transcriptional regulator C-terminal domain-containing protein [unclassified Pseudofrankia]MDT3442906.1 TetR/AcrR family transcriptional regulator C-terminal domain-containing protein [Pseudofrankia sp. BMG5.37]OHV62874.1 hypothetical protein BCD48_39040 [Pseudofrankia sp. BMG5.36]
MSAGDGKAGQRRRPGRPARIGRAQIVAVARSLDPAKLTIQAVADQLQVERSAVHYHVSDREQLLALVASDIFQSEVELHELPVSDNWRTVLRDLAFATRDAVVKVGVLLPYFHMQRVDGNTIIRSLEQTLGVLREAGLTEVESVRAMVFVSQIAFASARDTLLMSPDATHPQIQELKDVLAEMEPAEAPHVANLLQIWDAQSDTQLDFSLAVFIEGMEARLASRDIGVADGDAALPPD